MVLSEIKLQLPIEGADAAAVVGGKVENGALYASKGESADFTTYFNAFDADFFYEYTTVRRITLKLDFTGRACVVLLRYKRTGKPKDMRAEYSYERAGACVSEGGCEITVDIARGGILGFVFKAETDAVLLGGSWNCDDSCAINSVRPGFVICTYKRENDAIRNAAVLNESLKNEADIFVVDNGNTLKETDLPDGVKLIANKNLGGSGGFTRGIIECKRNRNTHFVLTDDDIVIDGRTALATVNILKVLKKEKAYLSLGGAMLGFAAPSVVYEAGAYVGKAKLRLPKHNVPIAEKSGLVWCAAKAEANYSGWWYYCAPVSAVDEYGYPMPFFIKYDDAEYGLRTSHSLPLAFPLGLGIWHKEFEEKLPPYMYYYLRRNSLITSAVSGNGSVFYALLKLFGSVAEFVKSDPKALSYTFDGYEDFLKGVIFLENADGEKLHEKIIKSPRKERGAFASVMKAVYIAFKLIFRMPSVRSEFRASRGRLCSEEAWEKRLGL